VGPYILGARKIFFYLAEQFYPIKLFYSSSPSFFPYALLAFQDERIISYSKQQGQLFECAIVSKRIISLALEE